MRVSTVAFLMILTTMFLSACEQEKRAQVEDRGNHYYGRSVTPMAQVISQPVPASPQFASPQVARAQAEAAPTTVLARSDHWQWPVTGKVLEGFGPQKDGTASEGITIAAAEGTPIHAAQGGEVAFVGKGVRDYGNMVILRHADGSLTSYSHAREIIVKKGDTVASGAVVGYVGTSGSAKTPQLHFALREGSRAVDPMAKLPQHVASN